MKRFYEAYEWIAPLLLLPLAYWLLAQRLGASAAQGLCLSLVAYGYLIPGLGTNWTRLYQFRARLRWGGFRPQQGFLVAGGMGLLLALLLALPLNGLAAHAYGGAFLFGSVLTAYDAWGIRSGYIEVRNDPWAAGRGHWAIALDYAPVYFGSFGAVLGAYGWQLHEDTRPVFHLVGAVALCTLPVMAHAVNAYALHGHSGLWPRARPEDGHAGVQA